MICLMMLLHQKTLLELSFAVDISADKTGTVGGMRCDKPGGEKSLVGCYVYNSHY